MIGFMVEYDVLLDFGYVCGYNLIGIMLIVVGIGFSKVVVERGGKVYVYGMFVEEIWGGKVMMVE